MSDYLKAKIKHPGNSRRINRDKLDSKSAIFIAVWYLNCGKILAWGQTCI